MTSTPTPPVAEITEDQISDWIERRAKAAWNQGSNGPVPSDLTVKLLVGKIAILLEFPRYADVIREQIAELKK